MQRRAIVWRGGLSDTVTFCLIFPVKPLGRLGVELGTQTVIQATPPILKGFQTFTGRLKHARIHPRRCQKAP